MIQFIFGTACAVLLEMRLYFAALFALWGILCLFRFLYFIFKGVSDYE